MSTETLINEVLELSGSYPAGSSRRRHRAWLAGKPTDWLLRRRLTLRETQQRPGGQKRLALQMS